MTWCLLTKVEEGNLGVGLCRGKKIEPTNLYFVWVVVDAWDAPQMLTMLWLCQHFSGLEIPCNDYFFLNISRPKTCYERWKLAILSLLSSRIMPKLLQPTLAVRQYRYKPFLL